MAALSVPVNYALCRKALVAALSIATGLDPSSIIRAEGQGPVQPRPKLPYVTFKFNRVSIRNGRDACRPAPGEGDSMWRYTGERGIAVDIQTYGRDQDEAYALASAIQFGLDTEPVADALALADLSVWSLGDATDITALLSTGFEGRALLECELWLGISVLVDLGEMASVPVVGVLTSDDGNQIDESFTVNLI
jgi:hypothetical protein